MNRSDEHYIDPVEIERELAAIWDSINRHQKDGHTVTRASMSNVMIFCDGEDQAVDAADRIPRLVRHHPARVLVLALIGEQSGDEVRAWVTAHSRRVGDRQQLCAEHIELRFGAGGAARTASIVRSLLISDLPSALWWLSPRPPALTGAVFEAFAPMANQIIYDSIGWADPPRGVLAMTQWSKNHRTVIFNLAWRRLKPWRRILSQSLAPSVVPGALQRIEAIELHHGPHALPLAWLLLGWLSSRLDWRPQKGVPKSGKQLVWQFSSPGGPVRIEVNRRDEGPPHIDRMRISWRGGDGHPASHADYRHEGHHIRHFPEDTELWPSSIPTVEQRLEQMVAAQLAHRAGDALFTASIAFSEAMAKVVKSDAA
ncbi:glucose-6-phosphate dehydrogenase assembly protein OpcA [Thiorhodococcus fuscus]|uniref:Glucose-6-phosphate dehydrogenase assembly protein OpcA n=1 Tax=Thiorhodococcus fuscus TaxID=527200 RepID=A0ABW4YDQ2_9GAMM